MLRVSQNSRYPSSRYRESTVCVSYSGGNQREKSREKAAKKVTESQKKKKAGEKDGNKGMTLEERRHRQVALD